ncbi:MAG: hypothetical protein R2830_11335 [Saprospiraceae bacterium]
MKKVLKIAGIVLGVIVLLMGMAAGCAFFFLNPSIKDYLILPSSLLHIAAQSLRHHFVADFI